MTQAGKLNFVEIGARLRAHRLGRGLSPEDLANRLGISRAALYRAEKGEIAKIEMLTAISDELHVSLPTLLGVGIEYVDNAIGFFERMRQIEEDAEQIIGLFSPISYLVTTYRYDETLSEVLRETPGSSESEIQTVLAILAKRKRHFSERRPLLVSIISDADIERFLHDGIEGRLDITPATHDARRRMALAETRHIVDMLRKPDFGIQIGVAREPIPSTSFQLVRKGDSSTLTISPFRLGHNPNIRVGAGMITSAPEALELHGNIAQRLWETSLKGTEAAEHVESLIERYGYKEEQLINN